MLTVKEWEQIRRAYHVEDKSLREIVRQTGRAFRTVKKMAESEEPPRYRRQESPQAHKLGPYKERIQELLAQNQQLPRKQRWTAPSIYRQIQADGYAGAESTVRHYVGQVRKLLKQPAVYLPLTFDPGGDAQMDWGEGDVILGGQQVTVQLFLMKLSYSRRTFMMAFSGQKQEALFAGHVAAFDFFGGVPQRISYDNLKTAVKEILQGRHRVEQEAFFHFRGYYLFESHFCTPGAGNEKGQVEHSVGFNRRNFLVPLPEVASFAELNDYLLRRCLADDERQVDGQPNSIGQMWQEERGWLRPLPARPFDCCRTTTVTLNGYSQVQLETNRYSVPSDLACRELTAKLYPFEVKLYRPGESEPIAVHPRCYDKHQEILDPLHYLSLLAQRPGAFDHAKPVRQWRAAWPSVYETLLAELRDKWPDGRGVREFIAILQLHRDHSQAEMEQAIGAALAHHCAHADGVRLWLTQLRQPSPTFPTLDLTDRPRLTGIGEQAVQAGTYDALLGGGQ
ncbi:MAG: IS21 family transposase [Chloroflexi bacterium]|nr:IS21 family transposase [Chloroflexota bacterium]MCI0574904.1 IS21 family transposase [Chloroflexota bacterium]MCI0647077.1 IS21 family transposase [Chloroflexota bacterium]MCI0727057.1 IS21 family transposase [Chloroflexota bacterium]